MKQKENGFATNAISIKRKMMMNQRNYGFHPDVQKDEDYLLGGSSPLPSKKNNRICEKCSKKFIRYRSCKNGYTGQKWCQSCSIVSCECKTCKKIFEIKQSEIVNGKGK